MGRVYEAFLPYRDVYGFNQVETLDGNMGRSTQNGTLFTMEYLLCLLSSKEPDEIKQSEIKRIKEVFTSSMSGKGLSLRFPGSKEFDSMDNNAALLVFSALYGNSEYAKDMRDVGLNVTCTGTDQEQDPTRNNKFYPLAKLLGLGKVKNFWNNQYPDKFCFPGWYGRSPGFMGLVDLCATGHTTWLRWAGILVGQFIGAFSEPTNSDARKLPYIVWQLLKHRNFFWKMFYKLWTHILINTYPTGMRAVYLRYYRNNENHPLVTESLPYIS